MNNKTTTECVTTIGEQQSGSYLHLLLYRAPKNNNEAIAKNLKQFAPSFKKHGARFEYYQQLDKSEFFGPVTQGKRLITGGFSPLRE
jgi:uncharacterized protein YbaA (DUF1428 family)